MALSAPLAAQTAGPSVPDDPFLRRSWNFQLASHAAAEIWNYNGNHEEMYGFVPGISYGVSDAVAAVVSFPMYYVDQRGVNASLVGVTFGLRSRLYRRGRMSVYFDFDVGISAADTYTPPRGTRFNYLALGTIGVMVPIGPGLQLMAGLRLAHLSNNGLAGRERNPDIEALGPQIGVLRRF
ncbi:MAG: acyloxyacyl hydrolase [Acidobacteriota bacterium]|nr:acyloxyacyl hydrolase [Acidobacteriota bacterium]